jgi:hypothetical protein
VRRIDLELAYAASGGRFNRPELDNRPGRTAEAGSAPGRVCDGLPHPCLAWVSTTRLNRCLDADALLGATGRAARWCGAFGERVTPSCCMSAQTLVAPQWKVGTPGGIFSANGVCEDSLRLRGLEFCDLVAGRLVRRPGRYEATPSCLGHDRQSRTVADAIMQHRYPMHNTMRPRGHPGGALRVVLRGGLMAR